MNKTSLLLVSVLAMISPAHADISQGGGAAAMTLAQTGRGDVSPTLATNRQWEREAAQRCADNYNGWHDSEDGVTAVACTLGIHLDGSTGGSDSADGSDGGAAE